MREKISERTCFREIELQRDQVSESERESERESVRESVRERGSEREGQRERVPEID